MPVSVFAKIKIRRGLREDLVDLDKAEFGYTTDTGELFIGAPDLPSLANKGKGEAFEQFPFKNIQVLTSGENLAGIQPYTYKGNSGYVAQTGPTPSNPIIRTYQSRFDDVVMFNDFRTSFVSSIDMSTDLNRALRQVYNGSTTADRKVLHMSAGEYTINLPIKLPPMTILKGEGIDRTHLIHRNPDPITGPSHVFETVDRKFQEGTQISTNAGGIPANIEVSDMTITIPRLMDFVRLYRASNVTFRRVKFKGAGAVASNTYVAMFDRLGMVINMTGFRFLECEFEDVSNILSPMSAASTVVSNVEISNSKITNVYQMANINSSNAKNFKFTNNLVTNVFYRFVEFSNGTTFKSEDNIFELPTFTGGPNSVYHIAVNGAGFTSINDTFNCPTGVIPIRNASNTSVVLNPQDRAFTFRDTEYSEVFRHPILGGQIDQSLPTTFSMDVYDSVFIDYSVKRGTNLKVGQLKLTHDLIDPVIFDLYNQINTPDINFTVVRGVIDGVNHMVIRYTTGGTESGTLTYSYKGMKTG